MRLIQHFASVGHYGLDFRCTDGFSFRLPTPVAAGSVNL